MKKSKRLIFSFIPFSSIVAIPLIASSCNDTTSKDEQKNIDEVANKLIVDYENKEQTLIKNIKQEQVKFSNFDGTKYEPIIKKAEVIGDSYQVTYLLKSKINNLISKEVVKTISGFKKEENPTPPQPKPDLQKELNDLAESLKAKYEDDVNKTDANEVDLNKISLVKKDNSVLESDYQIKDKKFVNENATNDEIYNGVREFTFKLVKNELESVEIKTSILVHKSAKALQELRESLKSKWKINNSYTSKETLEKLANDSTLYLDYKTGGIYDKEYADKTKRLLFKATSWIESEFDALVSDGNLVNYKNDRNKVTLKKNGDKYSFTFNIGLPVQKNKPETWRIDYRTTQTNEMQFSLPTIEKINEIGNTLISTFDYENKSDVELKDIIDANIKYGQVPTNYKVKLLEVKKDFANNKIIVKYSVIYIDENNFETPSKEFIAEINGFKQDALDKEFENLAVDYNNKDSILASNATDLNEIKLTKNNVPYTPGADIELTKEIISHNDSLGTIDVKITIKKNEKSLSQTFTITGFKQKTFNLEELVNRLKIELDSRVNKSTYKASMVKEEDITITDPENQLQTLNDATIIKTLTVFENEGKLKVKVTVKYNEKEFSKEAEFDGFLLPDEVIRQALRDAGNDLFEKLDQSQIDKLESLWNELSSGQKNKGIYLKDTTFVYGKNSSHQKGTLQFRFKNDKFNQNQQYRDVLFRSIVNHEYGNSSKNRAKALYIKKNKDGKFYIEYRLFDSKKDGTDAKKYPTVYKWEMQ